MEQLAEIALLLFKIIDSNSTFNLL
jgi:hypothetical protein